MVLLLTFFCWLLGVLCSFLSHFHKDLRLHRSNIVSYFGHDVSDDLDLGVSDVRVCGAGSGSRL